jgi:hypothetical protein
MREIYSKVNPEKLLHIVYKAEDFYSKPGKKQRTDVVPNNAFLQVASIRMEEAQTFIPHKHIEYKKETNITQESWVVIKGKVLAILYDIDDSIIHEETLCPGDCSITLLGGHNYKSLVDDTCVLEYKTGPYFGQEKDKVFIK